MCVCCVTCCKPLVASLKRSDNDDLVVEVISQVCAAFPESSGGRFITSKKKIK